MKESKENIKLIMTLLVRDEEDIIRQNIEFHLSHGVDFIIATDNGSIDGTREILKEYEDKGILFLIDEKTQDYSQAEWVNRMGEIAFGKYMADIIFHCDADEFWYPKSGNLKNELMCNDKVDVLSVNVINILLEDKEGKEEFPEDTRYAVVKPIETNNYEEDSKKENLYLFKYPPKVIYRIDKGYIPITQGNHSIINQNNYRVENSQDITIFHYPIRSKEHFFKKIINVGSSYEANEKLDKGLGFHWRRWYESYKNDSLDEEYKKLILSNNRINLLLNNGILKEFDFNKLKVNNL